MKQRGRSICSKFRTKGTELKLIELLDKERSVPKCQKTLTKRSVPKRKKEEEYE